VGGRFRVARHATNPSAPCGPRRPTVTSSLLPYCRRPIIRRPEPFCTVSGRHDWQMTCIGSHKSTASHDTPDLTGTHAPKYHRGEDQMFEGTSTTHHNGRRQPIVPPVVLEMLVALLIHHLIMQCCFSEEKNRPKCKPARRHIAYLKCER
jgi:hypothetical protein